MSHLPHDATTSTDQIKQPLDEARYRALVEATRQVICTCAPDGSVIGDMRSWQAFTGQTDAMADKRWFVMAHPDDVATTTAVWNDAVAGKNRFEHEARLRRYDGVYRDVIVRAAPVLAVALADHEWIVACTDITDRKRLEQQNLAALAVLLRVEQIVTDPMTQDDVSLLLRRVAEALWNLAAVDFAHTMGISADGQLEPLAIFGMSVESEAEWRARVQSFDTSANQRGAELLALLSTGQPLVQHFDSEAPVISPLVVSTYRICAAITVPVLVQDRLIGVLTVSRMRPKDPGAADYFAPWDMDLLIGVGRLTSQALTRMRLRDQLTSAEAAQLAAEATTRQRDAFLSIASHELRTPLTSVSVNIQLLSRYAHDLRRALADDAEQERVERLENVALRAERQVQRLNRLVDDLLDIARIEAGKLDLHVEPCDLLTIVTEAIVDQRDAWPERAITFASSGLDTLPLIADADRIGQVVTNLLTNALKYSAADQPVAVQVSVAHMTARVAVCDHGPGIPIAHQAHLFEQFYRVPEIALRSGTGIGLGLGLSICKTLIARHAGEIGVDSVEGQGSTFWFTLPLAETMP